MYGYIYKTTNKLNDKIYIGQKKSDIFLENKYLGSGKYLKHAINKYGAENFTVDFVDKADSREQLSKLEIYYIALYNSTDKTIGYNIAKGGIGGGEVYVNNGMKNEFISKKNLDQYLAEGWQLGMLPGRIEINHSPTRGNSISKALKGKPKTREQVEKHRQALKAAKRHWYTTGVPNQNLLLPENVVPPQGYFLGKTVDQEFKNKCGYKNIGRTAWNKGLTKETDERIAKQAESLKKYKHD